MDEQFSAAQDMIYDLILNTNKEKFTKDEFDAKWESAMTTLNGIVDVYEMERKMTEIAKTYAADLAQ